MRYKLTIIKLVLVTVLLVTISLSACTQRQKETTSAKRLAEACYKNFLDNSAVKEDRTYFSIKAKSAVLNVDEWRVIVKAEYPTKKEPKCAQIVIKNNECVDVQNADC